MKPRRMAGRAAIRRATLLKATGIDARRQLLRALQKELNASARRAERTADPTAVHDVRIATRRVRILLRALRHDTDPALYTSVRFELRNIAGAAGPAREAYVRRQIVSPWLESRPDHSVQAMEACSSVLDAELEEATIGLRAIMQGGAWSSSLARINRALASPRLFGLASGDLRGPLAASFARLLRSINHTLRRVENLEDKCHPLRVKVKNARYLGEMLHSLSGKPGVPLTLHLQKMQSALGDLHDAMQFHDWLHAAGLPDPARKILLRKVGKLGTRQLDRCRKHRKSLGNAVKQFLLAGRAT